MNTLNLNSCGNLKHGSKYIKDLKVNLNEKHRLPSGYLELTYIESTGTQYISTQIFAEARTKVEVKWKFNSATIPQAVLGVVSNSSQVNKDIFQLSWNGSAFSGVGNVYSSIWTNLYKDTTNVHIATLDTIGEAYIDNTEVGWTNDVTYQFNDNLHSILLFARYNYEASLVQNKATISMYYFKAWKDNVLTRNMIPCKRISDNEVGMYDLVSNTFFTNQGTGSFIAGEAVKTMWQNPSTDVSASSPYVSVPSSKLGNADMKMLGGMSRKFNQLVQNGNFVDTSIWLANLGTLTVNNNVGTITATDTAWSVAIMQSVPCVQNHKYYVAYYLKPSVSGMTRCYWNGNFISNGMPTTANVRTQFNFIFTADASALTAIYIYLNRYGNTVGDTGAFDSIQLIDLTAMFGAGNEPSTVAEFKALFPNDYYPYTQGTLIDAPCDKVVSRGADTTLIAEKTIPSTLTSQCPVYGIGVNASCYNYIDWVEKKYHRKVGKVDLGRSLNWSLITNNVWCSTQSINTKNVNDSVIPNFITNNYNADNFDNLYYATNINTIGLYSGTTRLIVFNNDTTNTPTGTLYYELATEEVIDISAYIPTNFDILSVESGGELTYHYPQLDNGYTVNVPTTTKFYNKY